MKFIKLLELTIDVPIFNTGFLLVGNENSNDIRKQLSRWVKSGKIIKYKKGIYSLAEPYIKNKPHPFLIANYLSQGSYISYQTALAHYGMIPEYVQLNQSATLLKSSFYEPNYKFHHIKQDLFFGFTRNEIKENQNINIATPEKALIDLIHITKKADSKQFLANLRLQNLNSLNMDIFNEYVYQFNKPKIFRAYTYIKEFVSIESEEYKEL